MNEDSDPLLSSLCSICHIKPHQYRCPRCAALTCSLSCIKRHKQWAQCNGIRDPAAYVKRSDLATPAGIDHDYNYLTSIEREFDKAEREAVSRGVVLLDGEGKKKDTLVKGEVNLKAALERCGVIVARAPKGMSRNKRNGTRWLKGSHCLEWTVEWVHPDGRKELAQCRETLPIIGAYGYLDSMRPKKRKEDIDANQARPKRRRKHFVNDQAAQSSTLGPEGGIPKSAEALDHAPDDRQKETETGGDRAIDRGHTSKDRDMPADGGSSAKNADAPTSNGHRECQAPTEAPKANLKEPNIDNASKHSDSVPLPSAEKLSFYLHTPSLPCPHIVLAPIKPEANLSSLLPTRLVLEYPTIYVFKQIAEEKPPDGFLTEEEFYKMARKEIIEELDEGEIVEESQFTREEQGVEMQVEALDEKKLLEVLGKDLGAG